MNKTTCSKIPLNEILRMPITEQKRLLSNIEFDDLFEILQILGVNEMDVDGTSAIIRSNKYIYTWDLSDESESAVAISVSIELIDGSEEEINKCKEALDNLSADIDVEELSITFEETVDQPFVFGIDGKASRMIETNMSSILGEVVYNGEIIGNILFYKFNNDDDFLLNCDDESGDLVAIAAQICSRSGRIQRKFAKKNEKVVLLDKIKILPQYRGKGIGQLIMCNLQNMMSTQFGVRKIFLLAGAFEAKKDENGNRLDNDDAFNRQSDKLVEFYSRCGFTHINNRVMYIN